MVVDAATYRNVLSRWAAGVSVVTVARDDEDYHGITVSSFASLSLEPPLVLVCIDKEARSHDLIEAAGAFAVNLLHSGQADVSDRFAGRVTDATEGLEVEVDRASTGTPVLSDCLAYLDCSVADTADGGDHTIFIGHVEAAAVVKPDATPLVYFHRRYRELQQ